VWLFSLDSSRYPDAVPLTTGGLKAYLGRYGRTAGSTEVRLVHFRSHLDVSLWFADTWLPSEKRLAEQASQHDLCPIAGISCYTWNTKTFLNLVRRMKQTVPGLRVVAGGPQVQEASAYLEPNGIDVVVQNEGEVTFQVLMDATFDGWTIDSLRSVEGISFLESDGRVFSTPMRRRMIDLDLLPSPLDAIELRDGEGGPRYRRVSYETTRGCPFRCAFCEWGTGAIGTKMHQHSIERIRSDLTRLVDGGVGEIFFSDSNFGALREDVEKAECLIDLSRRVERPLSFATSWSKSHNARVQGIARRLHESGLLEHYTLSLQTLTESALETSRRSNMSINQFRRIANAMARDGVPITSELIWGLPGDNLAEFRANLDELTGVFPSISIYGYTLLPGTEFYARRHEYAIETVTLREVGNWELDYVVACYSFDRHDGVKGYFLAAAHSILNRGNIVPLATRYIALDGRVSVSAVLTDVLEALIDRMRSKLDGFDGYDGLAVYSLRDRIYFRLLGDKEATFEQIRRAMLQSLEARGGDARVRRHVAKVLELDQALCPDLTQRRRRGSYSFGFDGQKLYRSLVGMTLPDEDAFEPSAEAALRVVHPEGASDLLAPAAIGPQEVRGHHAVAP
jgi:hypothetical protein